jgi:hypothetical protein
MQQLLYDKSEPGNMTLLARPLLLCALFLGSAQLAVQPSHAQAPSGPNTQAKIPISVGELQKYQVLSAINICSLLQDKVRFEVAVKANIASVGSLIVNLHGSMIQGVNNGQPLTNDQLTQGLSLQIASAAASQCPKLIPEANLADIKKALSGLQKK